jgi:hypothetical protein
VPLDCDGHRQIVYKLAPTTSPAHAVDLQDKFWAGEKHPSGEASSDLRTPKPTARRAVTPAPDGRLVAPVRTPWRECCFISRENSSNFLPLCKRNSP